MSCSRPNRMFDTGYKTKEGKAVMVMTNYFDQVQFIYKPRSANNVQDQSPNNVYLDKKITKYIEVACQECESCLADKAKEFAFRAIAECKASKNNWVINLTYNEENIPTTAEIDENGEVTNIKCKTLFYKDVQDFKKKLKRHWEYKYGEVDARFSVAGEYGEQYGRPHYHIIAYNLDIKDLKFNGYTKKGSREYLSEEIQKLWEKGFVTIGDADTRSILYVANYCLKKIKGSLSEQHYNNIGKCPEFVQHPRNPGLGAKWLLEHLKDYKQDGKLIISAGDGQTLELHSCQYLNKILKKENEEEFEIIKAEKSKRQELREKTRAALSGVSLFEHRKRKAEEFHEKIKMAKRRKFD